MLNFCGIVAAILKMETSINFSMSVINSGRWNWTMLNLCGIVVVILKMATGRNFSMSRIHSGHHNLPTYEMALKSDNVEFVWYCGGHFENGDRYKFFNVGNQFGTSLSTHISNFDDIGQCWIFAVLWQPFWKWWPVEIVQYRLIGNQSGHHYLPTYKILMISDNVEFLPSIFYAVFWQPFWKWQTSR